MGDLTKAAGRHIEAMTKVIHKNRVSHDAWIEYAKAAIAASDAKYVPMLVEALKRMSGYAQHDDNCTINDWHNIPECNCGYTEAWRSAQEILEKLPEDLR